MSDQTSNQDRTFDKSTCLRQQLSALMDGALAPDEARFLLRRMQHDRELSEIWERWQLAGDVSVPRGCDCCCQRFRSAGWRSDRRRPDASTRQTPSRSRWARWGGSIALAASVAVVALLATRQGPDAAGQRSPDCGGSAGSNLQAPISSTSSPSASSRAWLGAGATFEHAVCGRKHAVAKAPVAIHGADAPCNALASRLAARCRRRGSDTGISSPPPPPRRRPRSIQAGTLPSSGLGRAPYYPSLVPAVRWTAARKAALRLRSTLRAARASGDDESSRAGAAALSRVACAVVASSS